MPKKPATLSTCMRKATAALLLLGMAGCLGTRYDCDACVPGTGSTCVTRPDRDDIAVARQRALSTACIEVDYRCFNGRVAPTADDAQLCAAVPAKAPSSEARGWESSQAWDKACWEHPELWRITCRKVRYVPWPFPG
jgi:hypothetical protein